MLNVQWRPKEPPIFSGKPTKDADGWVSVVNNYYMFMNSTPHQEVAYAAALLCDATHNWWQAYLDRNGRRIPQDWATLSAAFVGRFGGKSRAKQALSSIMT